MSADGQGADIPSGPGKELPEPFKTLWHRHQIDVDICHGNSEYTPVLGFGWLGHGHPQLREARLVMATSDNTWAAAATPAPVGHLHSIGAALSLKADKTP